MSRARKIRGILMAAIGAVVVASVFYGAWSRQVAGTITPLDLQLEVLNGTGSSGIAREYADGLRRLGIDVKLVGNADAFDYPQTLLLSRRGRLEDLRRLGRRIGCDRVIEQVDEDLFVDGTLVLGKDAGEVLKIPR